MADFSLTAHPDYPSASVRGVTVALHRHDDRLRLLYRVEGAERLVWPAPAPPAHTDGLWRTTCLELFVRADGERYHEFNFSPSMCWAAYAFNGYRAGMTALPLEWPPHIERLPDGVRVECDLAGLPRESAIGLSAVIEEAGGVKSFWALAHPTGAPDFHHPACFAATLPPPAAP